MMKSCNPANLTAKLLAQMVHRGADVDADTFKKMPGEAKGVFADALVEASANELEATPRSLTREELAVAKALGLGGKNIEADKGLKAMLHETRLMSDILGDEVIDQAQAIHTDIMRKYGKDMETNPSAGRPEYNKRVRDLVEAWEDRVPEAQKAYWLDYKRFLEKGGGTYGHPVDGSRAEAFGRQIVGNVVSNQVTMSPTVLFGNMMEISKAIILYPDTALQALPKALRTGGFGKVPELERIGFYARGDQGVELPENPRLIDRARAVNNKIDNWFKGSIEYTSRPMQAWAYYAGKLRGGHKGGVKAVENVSFNTRAMNPTLGRARGTGLFTQLLHFSTMSAKMYGGLWNDAVMGKTPADKARAVTGLLLLHGGTAAVMAANGAAEGKDPAASAQIGLINSIALAGPAIYEAIKVVNPEFKDWAEENAPSLLQLTQTTASPGFVGTQIALSKGERLVKEMKKAALAFAEGDTETGARQSARALMTTQVFMKNPLGNRLSQNIADFILDANEGKFDIGSEGAQQAAGRLTPFYKDVVKESKQ